MAINPSDGTTMVNTVTAIPMLKQNIKSIRDYAKKKWQKITNEGVSGSGSIYFTIYIYFKKNVNYTIEAVNSNICSLLKDYEYGKGYTYNYKNKNFVINLAYDYSDKFYILNDYYEDYQEDGIEIPTVAGISLYFQPENLEKSIVSIGNDMIETLTKELLQKFEVNSIGSFIYVESKTEPDLDIIKNKIDRLIKKLEVQLKFYPTSSKEIKFKLDSMSVKIVEDVIWS